jgi:hypothetical protein
MNYEAQGIGNLPEAGPIREVSVGYFGCRGAACRRRAAPVFRFSQIVQVRSQKRTTSGRTVTRRKIQSVAVILPPFSHSSGAQLFIEIVRFPLDNSQKQPMMWRKVGQSGQQ